MKCKECGHERTCDHGTYFVTVDRFEVLRKGAIIKCKCNRVGCEITKDLEIVDIKLKELK